MIHNKFKDHLGNGVVLKKRSKCSSEVLDKTGEEELSGSVPKEEFEVNKEPYFELSPSIPVENGRIKMTSNGEFESPSQEVQYYGE